MSGGGHIVQFYETEASLVELAAAYLAEGAVEGAVLIVIATASHAGAVAAAVAAKAPYADPFILVDADELLPACTAGSLPIDELMRGRIESAVAATGASPERPIRFYGRLADQLMTNGNSEASLALEDFWTSFIEGRSMSILCAHRLESFYEDKSGRLLNEVCARHGRADPGI